MVLHVAVLWNCDQKRVAMLFDDAYANMTIAFNYEHVD